MPSDTQHEAAIEAAAKALWDGEKHRSPWLSDAVTEVERRFRRIRAREVVAAYDAARSADEPTPWTCTCNNHNTRHRATCLACHAPRAARSGEQEGLPVEQMMARAQAMGDAGAINDERAWMLYLALKDDLCWDSRAKDWLGLSDASRAKLRAYLAAADQLARAARSGEAEGDESRAWWLISAIVREAEHDDACSTPDGWRDTPLARAIATANRQRNDLVRVLSQHPEPRQDQPVEDDGWDLDNPERTKGQALGEKITRTVPAEQDQPVDRASGEADFIPNDDLLDAGLIGEPVEHPKTGEREERGFAIQRAVYAAVHHERRHGMEKNPALLAGRVTDILAGRTPVDAEDEPWRDALAQPDDVPTEPLQDDGERREVEFKALADHLREALGFMRSCARSGENGADHSTVVSAIEAYEGFDFSARHPHQDVEPGARERVAEAIFNADYPDEDQPFSAAVEKEKESYLRCADAALRAAGADQDVERERDEATNALYAAVDKANIALAEVERLRGAWCRSAEEMDWLADLSESQLAEADVERIAKEVIERFQALAPSPDDRGGERQITTAHRVSERDGEVVVEPPIKPGCSIYLDGQLFTVQGSEITAAELHALPAALRVPGDFEIWIEQPQADDLVLEARPVRIEGGERFYTTPRQIQPGAADQSRETP